MWDVICADFQIPKHEFYYRLCRKGVLFIIGLAEVTQNPNSDNFAGGLRTTCVDAEVRSHSDKAR